MSTRTLKTYHYRGHTLVEGLTGKVVLLYEGIDVVPPCPEKLIEDYPSLRWAMVAAEQRYVAKKGWPGIDPLTEVTR
jgi:hypothetical protein